jgi:hypothetical protein
LRDRSQGNHGGNLAQAIERAESVSFDPALILTRQPIVAPQHVEPTNIGPSVRRDNIR